MPKPNDVVEIVDVRFTDAPTKFSMKINGAEVNGVYSYKIEGAAHDLTRLIVDIRNPDVMISGNCEAVISAEGGS